MGIAQTCDKNTDIEMEDIADDVRLLSYITVPFELPKGTAFNFFINGKSLNVYVYCDCQGDRKIMFGTNVEEKYRKIIKDYIKSGFFEIPR